MADNLAKGSRNLEGKGGSLKGEKMNISKSPPKDSDVTDRHDPKLSTSKINETGKGSGNR
jgi:hypothetical protein